MAEAAEKPLLLPAAPDAQNQGSRWRTETFIYDSGVPVVGKVGIRAGFYAESADVAFRGNILYLQGLGDSMLNHDPLFARLSQAGYRVISFDYMGQGGSGGTMNHTRVIDVVFPALQISSIAEDVWARYRRPVGGIGNRKIIIGWSTGGLAAYEMARRSAADAVILLAPGIHTKLVVGEKFKITLPSLTRADYSSEKDPHVDPIRPVSPLIAPLFSKNLLAASLLIFK